MKQVVQIDSNGLFIEPVIVDSVPTKTVEKTREVIVENADGTTTTTTETYYVEEELKYYEEVEEETDDTGTVINTITTRFVTVMPETIHLPKWDFTNSVWVEGKSDAELLEQAKASKIAELNGICREEIVKGYSVALSSTVTNEYENELHDQRNLALKGLKVLMDTAITSIPYKTKNKGVVTHTRDEFLLVVQQSDTHIENNLTKYRDLKAKAKVITITTTLADALNEVKAIVW